MLAGELAPSRRPGRKPAYTRSSAIQAHLALTGFMLGLITAYVQSDWRLLLGALMLAAHLPFTLIVLLRVNNRLLAMEAERAARESEAVIQQFRKQLAARSGPGAAAALFLWAALPFCRRIRLI